MPTNPTPTLESDVRIFIISLVYRVFDMLTPTDMQKAIFEQGNRAVAIIAGAFILGLAIIIAAAIAG